MKNTTSVHLYNTTTANKTLFNFCKRLLLGTLEAGKHLNSRHNTSLTLSTTKRGTDLGTLVVPFFRPLRRPPVTLIVKEVFLYWKWLSHFDGHFKDDTTPIYRSVCLFFSSNFYLFEHPITFTISSHFNFSPPNFWTILVFSTFW